FTPASRCRPEEISAGHLFRRGLGRAGRGPLTEGPRRHATAAARARCAGTEPGLHHDRYVGRCRLEPGGDHDADRLDWESAARFAVRAFRVDAARAGAAADEL